jgi:hypothetical protein
MGHLGVVGDAAVALGEADFKLPLIDGLGRTVLQNFDAYPRVLSANLVDRVTNYPHPARPNESMIGDVVIASGTNGAPSVGIAAVTGTSAAAALANANVGAKFDRNDVVLKAIVEKLAAAKG